MATLIGDIRRKLDACISARNAQDSAARVYDDAMILVKEAGNLVVLAEGVLDDMAAAAEAAESAKEAAAAALAKGATDLLATIMSAKSIKKGNALDTCLAVRETVNTAAQIVDQMKKTSDSAAELSSAADAQLAIAESAWTEQVRIFDDAVASAEAAQASMIEAAKIIGL